MSNYYFGQGSTYLSASALSSSDIQNIKLVTQTGWSALHILDQSVSTTSTVTHYDLTLSDKLKLSNLGFTVSLQAPTLAASYSLLLPTADGTVGQVLKTNGSGQLGWVTTFSANQSLDTTSSPRFAYLGINQAAGTERLEVTGNIKSTGLLLSTGVKSTPNLSITTAGVYHPPGWPGYESLLGVVELRSLQTDSGHACGILFSNMYSSRQHRVATSGDGYFRIRDDTAGADRLYIDTSGNATVSGNITSEASRVFLQGSAPDQANALFMRWQGGTGKSYIVNSPGSGGGEIAMGHYVGSNYYEQLAIGLQGGIRVYSTGTSAGSAIGQFYNASLAAGNEMFLTLGIGASNSGDNAWMMYHRDGTTLANSVGKLGVWGYSSALSWSGNGKVAIGDNVTPGTYPLEVTGSILSKWATDDAYVILGKFYNSALTAGHTVFIGIGIEESANKCLYLSYERNATLANSTGRLGIWGKDDIINWSYNTVGRVGINQAPGTEVFEVNGNIKSSNFAGVMGNSQRDSNVPAANNHVWIRPKSTANQLSIQWYSSVDGKVYEAVLTGTALT